MAPLQGNPNKCVACPRSPTKARMKRQKINLTSIARWKDAEHLSSTFGEGGMQARTTQENIECSDSLDQIMVSLIAVSVLIPRRLRKSHCLWVPWEGKCLCGENIPPSQGPFSSSHEAVPLPFENQPHDKMICCFFWKARVWGLGKWLETSQCHLRGLGTGVWKALGLKEEAR